MIGIFLGSGAMVALFVFVFYKNTVSTKLNDRELSNKIQEYLKKNICKTHVEARFAAEDIIDILKDYL